MKKASVVVPVEGQKRSRRAEKPGEHRKREIKRLAWELGMGQGAGAGNGACLCGAPLFC